MLVNTQYFREEANNFIKTGYYTNDPRGSNLYNEYWKEQLKRCVEGYEVGGQRITGDHYFYLNFCQIRLTDSKSQAVTKQRTTRKITIFPDFWDGDYNFFHAKDIARHGITPYELKRLNLDFTVDPNYLNGGYHMIVGKARRKGYSYKNGAIVANTYNTQRKSLSIIGAFEKKYLYPKGTMQMVTDYMNFLNQHTAFAKRRSVVDKQDHRRASFMEGINGIDLEMGYMSEVIAITYKDNPDAARGKDADLVLFEEAGKFDNLKAAYLATKPVVEDGDITTGQMIIFGTGGDMEGGTIDFESMFYNPEPYNLLPFENIWDDGGLGTYCGFFHPSYINKVGFLDKDGNSLKDKAIQSEEAIRENIKRTSKDPGTYDKHITEYPFNPKEAFLQTGNNIFPLASIVEHKNHINRSNISKFMGIHGDLARNSSGSIIFKPNEFVRPVDKFPHDNKSDNSGCVTIYQPPFRHADKVPENMYLLCHDPYDHDGTSGSSLGSAYVLKRPNNVSQPDDMIVASYVGRPMSQDEYNRNLFMLAEFYNCRIGFENDRGDVIGFARKNKLLHLLEEEFELSYNSNLPKSGVRRGYGMHMTESRKRQGELYLRDWLLQVRSIDQNGNKMLNLHSIYDIPLLDELRTYNPTKGNYDRVSSLLIGMYFMKEIEYKQAKVILDQEKEVDSFFNRSMF